MTIDPLVVAVGAALCLVPVGVGLLVAWWPRPSLKPKEEREAEAEFQRHYDEVFGADEAWRRDMRDEGDIHAYRGCPCPMCRDRRTEREISDRKAERAKAERDMLLYGTGFMVDGKRVDPSEVVILPAKSRE